LVPGLPLKSGVAYQLSDLYYPLKSPEIRRQSTVTPTYHYPAAHLITQGLYVELGPYDAHIFLIEPHAGSSAAERLRHALRSINEGLPLPRVARRILGTALMRSSDSK